MMHSCVSLKVATSFWMYNGFRASGSGGLDLGSQLRLYNTYLGEEKDNKAVEKTFGSTGKFVHVFQI